MLADQVFVCHDVLVKSAATFSWQKSAVHLSAEFDAQLFEAGFRSALARPAGMAVSFVEMTTDAPHNGEMHPDGDEVIFVLEGRFRVRLGGDDSEYIEVAAGQGVVIPRGVWHKIHVLAPCRLVTLTPGPRFEYQL